MVFGTLVQNRTRIRNPGVIKIGSKERIQRELADRKQLIIEKSKELFFSRGFDNVSIQDICDAIEYGKSAVYNLFESKEEIYGFVFVEAVQILADLLNEVDASTVDLEDPLTEFTAKIYCFFKEYKPYYTALFFFDFNHRALLKIPDHIIRQKHLERERGAQPVYMVLNNGIETGVLRPFDIQEMINTYFASLLGIINTFIIDQQDADPEALREIMIRHAKIYGRGMQA
ncbi:MAG: TetR/AcrR family transcriptional regulator [Proteobacteria bacterium]|nr:TetR/AcrR family transcriptional regulator [Pseudomonadota bacterium]